MSPCVAGAREVGLAGLSLLILLAGAAELRTWLRYDVGDRGTGFMLAALDAPQKDSKSGCEARDCHGRLGQGPGRLNQ